jgi:hypothetical protein
MKGPSQSVWIPEEFLKAKNDLETVAVRQNGEWRRVLVKSGARRENQVEILSGIAAGEEIGLFEEES